MNLVRRAVEFLMRNHSTRARLPARFGRRPIYLSAGNHLAVLRPGDAKFEAYLLGFVDRFVPVGGVAWDIGVNMGMFAVPAATRASFTLGFEPDAFNLRLLQRTKEANLDLKLEVLPVAVSDQVGIAQLNIPERGRSANSLAGVNFGTQMGGVRGNFAVVTITLDWALDHFPPPDFVKCDAEGAETMILRGATRLLAEARPLFVIEMPDENAEACQAIFRANNYRCFSAYEPVDRAAELPNLVDAWDVLAIPAERVDDFIGK